MDNSTSIQEFLNYLNFEKHFSSHTSKCYGADLEQFVSFLKGHDSSEGQSHGDSDHNPWNISDAGGTATQTQTEVQLDKLLLDVDINTIRRFMASLSSQQYSKSTTARKLATLRSFYKFLVKRDYVSGNPVTTIKTPKQDKKLPKFLEYEEVQRLLNPPPCQYMAGSPGPCDYGSAL